MKIRILTSRGGHPCGAEVEVPDADATAWIGVGDAEAVQTSALADGQAADASSSEAPALAGAAPGDVETAMRKRARGR